MKKITIAIDGHSSCGKSTMAKELARKVGYVYVDTGAMYRCVTLFALRHQFFTADGAVLEEQLREAMPQIDIDQRLIDGKTTTFLNGENVEREIRNLEVSNHVSPIAAIPFVRTALVAQQQKMGREGGIVMDGRDIGTTCPAPLRRVTTERHACRLCRYLEERAGTRLYRLSPRGITPATGR